MTERQYDYPPFGSNIVLFEDDGDQFIYLNHWYLTLGKLHKLVTALIGSAVTLEL